ncbi:MAG: LysR family transcriptional regulator [Pseudohongiella sp.]|nr:MAG: LysR family transcriptional regulator [Pseudohongiella sp.]
MDTDLVKTFLEVSKTRHFGKASENLHVTQAAVSARIRQLEDFFGVSLFVRARNNIQLTAEGERLIPHAETMLLALSRARQDVILKQDLKRQLTIGATYGLWHFFLREKVSTLLKVMPGLAVNAVAQTDTELLRLLNAGAIDVAVLYEPVKTRKLAAESLGDLRLVLASSIPNIQLKPALSSNYVYVDWGTSFEMFHAKNFVYASEPVLRTGMATVAQSFILKNEASAYLPSSLLDAHPREITQVEDAPEFAREVYGVYRAKAEKIDLISELLGHLRIDLNRTGG